MKKKIATLLMFLFSCLSIFTGCNLFSKDNYASLSSVVAKSGDIEITREKLINAYNSSGYYYNQYYGQTMEQALRSTINDLINREYMLRYVESIEKDSQGQPTEYALNSAEKYTVITETWDYIDTSIQSVVEQVRKDLKLSTTELSTETEEAAEESEYKAKEVYEQKFEILNGKIVKRSNAENNFIPTNKTVYDYNFDTRINSTDSNYKNIVWNRYITALKKNQAPYKYSDTSDSATFTRELEKVYKTNLENAKLQKFENIYTSTYGMAFDSETGFYYLTDDTLQSVLTKYTSIYESNKELYDMAYNKESSINKNSGSLSVDTEGLENHLNSFYKTLTTTSSRENYVYYGTANDDEELLTCVHILVKFSEDQTKAIENAEGDSLLQSDLDLVLGEIKSQQNTKAYARSYDEDGVATISETPTSVYEVFEELKERIRTEVNVEPGHDDYLNQVTKIFDEFIYKYNQDTGIINAKFDYVVGTKNSAMVESFTEVVRKLYNNGQTSFTDEAKNQEAEYDSDVTLKFPNGVGFAGAISEPFLQESSNYSGYHIVMFTGTLKSMAIEDLTKNNVYSKLSAEKTSVAYGQNMFEFIYEKLAKDNYSQYQTNIIETLQQDITYNPSNFSDLYK